MPSDNASPIPESQIIPKAQEKPWYIQHFIKLLIGFGLGGGAVAILLPLLLWLHCGMSSGSSDQLRLHLLYVTGGIIAVLTLLQTNWKNQGDRLKIDADIKKNEQDAEKNERDHIRQVHAERRSRYTAAVGQLADEKAAIRLGGIYTLGGLVDEWLADDTLTPEEQQKEGQVIINNLCSYIRSPFPLAEKIDEYEARKELKELESKKPGTLFPDESSRLDTLRKRFEDSAEYQEPDDIAALQAAFNEEQDVRRTIFEEMSKRSSKVSMNKSKEVTVTPGAWSGFKFDFSRAPIFCPLNNLTIEQGQFTSARFYCEADFRGAKFPGIANFRGAKFSSNADFIGAKFAGNADFIGAKFAGNADFIGAKFAGNADFIGAKFAGNAYFGGAEFTGNADFMGAKFAGNGDLGGAEFTGNAYFGSAKFTRKADFRGAKFAGASYFVGSEFTSNTSFNGAYFKKYVPTFVDASGAARFSAQVDQKDYVFLSVRLDSKPINCGLATLGGKSYEIPLGAVLFDPDSWDEEKQKYTRISEPAR